MKTIEYVVQDCPIMGTVVVKHYVEEPRCNRALRNLKKK